MKKILTGIAVLASGVILSGCGHNIGTAFNGKVFNVGYDPELNKLGVQYYSGVMVTGLQKEHSKTNLSFEDDATGKDGSKTTSKLVYSTENGDQVTGYAVEKAKAESAAAVSSESTKAKD